MEYCGAQWSKWALQWGKGTQSVFLGTHEPRLDDKGRLILPAKFRDDLAAGLVMTKGQERCLNVWPTPRFEEITRGLEHSGSVTRKDLRDYTRVFLSGAFGEIPDKQGRVTIPPGLRRYAHLERDVAVIGAGDRVEIWDAAAWLAYLTEQEDKYASLAEEVMPSPIGPTVL